MRKFIDYTGQKIGRLTVLEKLATRYDSKGRSQIMWRCLCDCGRVTDKHSSGLGKRHREVGCGCIRKEKLSAGNKSRSVPVRERAVTRAFRTYRIGAELRDLSFTLPKPIVEDLIYSACFYCDSAPSNYWNGVKYNGIDRVDNSRGYEADNVVACCWQCNSAKKDMPVQDFVSLARRIARKWSKGESL